ncbi:MAG TPA: glycosyltransferase [Bacteroidota bacterium]|nr:glycosyltransferase [Bacteroidota bacterium]
MVHPVSVIVPTYNRKDLLAETIQGILYQTAPPQEIIVVDDGSTDGTAEFLASECGSSVILETIEHSGMPAVARNRGIQKATGQFLAFCDHDDVWLPEKLERQLEWMEMNNHDFCCADAYVYGSTNERYLDRYRFHFSSMQKNLVWSNFVISSSVIVRKDVVGNSRFPEDSFFRGYDDYLLWLELSRRIGIGFLPQPLLSYRIHDRNLGRENRSRDFVVQLRIVISERPFPEYAFISLLKIVKYLLVAVTSFLRNRS